ncbi:MULTISPECIES: glycosyltransferase family 2 protein [unclassified Ruegeria]|uniref:glycosyltransferase family 2 protein n=1 Tax=unclassified Ruegeria TaxID=2625375 RepID=UPI0014887C07|nr:MULTISPECIES: glycosyltransferase family 2 protein [unclassified Ruegeria]
MTDQLLFSIIMPAYNEEDVIEDTIRDLCEHLNTTEFHYELIVVDDASSDATAEILKKLVWDYPNLRNIHNAGPNGYGFAIRKGLEVYKGDAAVVVTSDGADAPQDVAAYFKCIADGADCAFGARFGPDSTVVGYPPVKRVINRVTNTLIGWMVGAPYRDFTNGFKCYRRTVIDDMQPLVAGQFNITIEMSLKAVLGGWNYSVVPNDWRQRDGGESSFSILKLIRPYGATLLYCLLRNYLMSVRR